MRRTNSQIALLATALVVVGCGGEKEIAPSPGTPTPPASAAEPAPEIDHSPRQRELFAEAIGLLERTGETLASITDRPSARQAATGIAAIGLELQSLAIQMEQTGPPAADLSREFTRRFGQAEAAMRSRVSGALPQLEVAPETVREVNHALDSLEQTLAFPAFRAYGIRQ